MLSGQLAVLVRSRDTSLFPTGELRTWHRRRRDLDVWLLRRTGLEGRVRVVRGVAGLLDVACQVAGRLRLLMQVRREIVLELGLLLGREVWIALELLQIAESLLVRLRIAQRVLRRHVALLDPAGDLLALGARASVVAELAQLGVVGSPARFRGVGSCAALAVHARRGVVGLARSS